jgi:hypothetical protein
MSGYRDDDTLPLGCYVAGILILVLIALVIGLFKLNSTRTVTATVTNRERVCNATGGSCKYLIWTKEAGVFEDVDSLLNGKFNSSDVYGQLDPGKVHTFEVQGWRLPFLSGYPNIIKVDK